MRSLLLGILAILILAAPAGAAPTAARVQIALLLDTSSSMDGLINQARSRLWKIVTAMSTARRDKTAATLELALYEYGNSGLSAKSGYLRKVSDFTTDLAHVSEQLHTLTTNGGEEYCPTVIVTSVDNLGWSQDPGDLRMIVIAGNEPFGQGAITPQEACKAANRKGITVTTLFCGNDQEGRRTGWYDGATCSGGAYHAIDTDEAMAYVTTPYDKELQTLNDRLNRTYLHYGAQGRKFKARQSEQDANAVQLSSAVMADRIAAKASGAYANSTWDIVDLARTNPVAAAELKEDDLPAELKGKTAPERRQRIDQLATERERINKDIRALDAKRADFIGQAQKAQASRPSTIDEVILKSIRALAEKKGFAMK